MTVAPAQRRQQEAPVDQPLALFAPSGVRALRRMVEGRTDPSPCLRLHYDPALPESERCFFGHEPYPRPDDEIVDVEGIRVLVDAEHAAFIRDYAGAEVKRRQSMYGREGKPYDKPFDYDGRYGLYVWYSESDLEPGWIANPQHPLRKKPTGQLALVRQEECTGCLICYLQCPVEAIVIVPGPDRRAVQQYVEIDYDTCIGCKECTVCPYDLIDVLPRAQVLQIKDDPMFTVRSFFA